jgi:DNA-binding response OmpR family regulator
MLKSLTILEPPKVVIADNDEDIGKVLRVILSLSGFEGYVTTSAEQCIAKITELRGEVSIVVINGKLAIDRNAMLITKIKTINNRIKILIVADRNIEPHKVRIMDYGTDEFLLKPASLETISNKVTMLVAEAAVKADSYKWQ